MVLLINFIKVLGFISIFIFSHTYANANYNLDNFYGEFNPKIKNDSLFIKYDLMIKREVYDSIQFQLTLNIDNSNTVNTTDTIWKRLEISKSNSDNSITMNSWNGQIIYPNFQDDIPNHYRLRLFYTENENISSNGDVIVVLPFFAIGGGKKSSVGLGFFTKSGFDPPIHSNANGLVWQLEDRMGRYYRNYSIVFGYSINHSKKFSLYDYGRIEGELILWGKDRIFPIFHAAVTYSRIKGYEDPNEFVKKGFGLEGGIRVESKFERFRYSYNTSVGGYHRFDMVFAISAKFGGQKIGTIYSLYSGKYARMISINVFMEGWGGNKLAYHNNRPFIHKALSIVGWLPFSPFILLMSLTE